MLPETGTCSCGLDSHVDKVKAAGLNVWPSSSTKVVSIWNRSVLLLPLCGFVAPNNHDQVLRMKEQPEFRVF